MNVVVIGGGTGTCTVLEALRDEPQFELTAIVSMADNGGSTGKLREELDVLPPGDLRQCLLALSTLPRELKAIFKHRFDKGSVNGHPVGNLLIAAAEQHCGGDIEQALCLAKALLQVHGNVVPVTTARTHLQIEHGDQITIGEIEITNTVLDVPRQCILTGNPGASNSALQAIEQADVIIIGPGNLYASLIPNFLVRGIPEAISATRARLIYLVNLVTSPGHTEGWDAYDYMETVEEYARRSMDLVIVNNHQLPSELLAVVPNGTAQVPIGELEGDPRLVCTELLDTSPMPRNSGDIIVRNRLRHDPCKLGAILSRLLLSS